MHRFYLTGRMAVEGHRVVDQADLPGRQGRLALAYLVLERQRPVPVEELASALWGDVLPPSWDGSLRVVVSKLRAALVSVDPTIGPPIAADGRCYQLRVLPAWVDVEEALRRIDRAAGAWARADVPGAWAEATVASGIARRPFLPGEDANWVASTRGRLRSALVRALEVLVDVWLARGDHQLAATTAQECVALEPFRESAHRRLVRAYLAAGNRAEALRAYERCRVRLAEELGVDPDPETQAIYLASLHG